GKFISNKIKSMLSVFNAFLASSKLPARTTAYPSLVKVYSIPNTKLSSSSTSKIRFNFVGYKFFKMLTYYRTELHTIPFFKKMATVKLHRFSTVS
ncbi:hypothetical protein AM598_01010, partial [Paenibacillus polymyxa]